MKYFMLAAMLSFAFTASAQTRFLPPEAGRTIVSLPRTSEQAKITAPDWITVDVTNGIEVETDKPVSVIIIRHENTTMYRTDKVVVQFPSQTITVEVFQAAPLSFVRNGNEVITHDCAESDVRKAWFVPDDGTTIPDLIFAAHRRARHDHGQVRREINDLSDCARLGTDPSQRFDLC